jgi:hypothetical protein
MVKSFQFVIVNRPNYTSKTAKTVFALFASIRDLRHIHNAHTISEDEQFFSNAVIEAIEARTLYYQDRSIGSSELSFRFQSGAAATQRPASESKRVYYGLYGERSIV